MSAFRVFRGISNSMSALRLRLLARRGTESPANAIHMLPAIVLTMTAMAVGFRNRPVAKKSSSLVCANPVVFRELRVLAKLCSALRDSGCGRFIVHGVPFPLSFGRALGEGFSCALPYPTKDSVALPLSIYFELEAPPPWRRSAPDANSNCDDSVRPEAYAVLLAQSRNRVFLVSPDGRQHLHVFIDRFSPLRISLIATSALLPVHHHHDGPRREFAR